VKALLEMKEGLDSWWEIRNLWRKKSRCHQEQYKDGFWLDRCGWGYILSLSFSFLFTNKDRKTIFLSPLKTKDKKTKESWCHHGLCLSTSKFVEVTHGGGIRKRSTTRLYLTATTYKNKVNSSLVSVHLLIWQHIEEEEAMETHQC
jgi:hypothetical protein